MKPEELATAKKLRQIQFKDFSDSLNERSMELGKLFPTGSEAPISDELWSRFISLWRDEGEWVALTYWHDAITLLYSESDASVQ